MPPTLWLGPDAACADWLAVFTASSQWPTLRAKITGLDLSPWHFYTPQTADAQFINGNIMAALTAQDVLRRVNDLQLSVGLIGITHPDWPGQGLSAQSISLDMLGNVAALGSQVDIVPLDTSIGRGVDRGLSQAQNVTELKAYYDAINAAYPGMEWGDSDCITSFTAATILSYLDAYIAGGIPLTFFVLDPVYEDPTTFNTQTALLATGLASRGLRFGINLNPGVGAASRATDADYCTQTYTFAQSVQSTYPTAGQINLTSFYSRISTGVRDMPTTLPEWSANTLTKLAADVAALFGVEDTHPLVSATSSLPDSVFDEIGAAELLGVGADASGALYAAPLGVAADAPTVPLSTRIGPRAWRGQFRGHHRGMA